MRAPLVWRLIICWGYIHQKPQFMWGLMYCSSTSEGAQNWSNQGGKCKPKLDEWGCRIWRLIIRWDSSIRNHNWRGVQCIALALVCGTYNRLNQGEKCKPKLDEWGYQVWRLTIRWDSSTSDHNWWGAQSIAPALVWDRQPVKPVTVSLVPPASLFASRVSSRFRFAVVLCGGSVCMRGACSRGAVCPRDLHLGF
jgi:hypothetical protein